MAGLLHEGAVDAPSQDETPSPRDRAQTPRGVAAGTPVEATAGLSGEVVQALAQAALAGVNAALSARLADLAQQLGMTQGGALALLRDLGQSDVPIERLPDALTDAAVRVRALREALRRPDNEEALAAARAILAEEAPPDRTRPRDG